MTIEIIRLLCTTLQKITSLESLAIEFNPLESVLDENGQDIAQLW